MPFQAKFANNPVRSTLTDTTKRIAALKIVIDKMHFEGHIDVWCRRYCNPNDFDELKKYMYTCKLIHITIQCALFIHRLTPKSVSKCFPGCRATYRYMNKAALFMYLAAHSLFYVLYVCDLKKTNLFVL